MNLKRALAIGALILIGLLLILLLVFSFTGAAPEYILALLFCIMVVPAAAYIYIWFMKLTGKK